MSALLESTFSEEIVFYQVPKNYEEIKKALKMLAEIELKEFENLELPIRKLQWLAGRIACKKAVELSFLKHNRLPPLARHIILAPSIGTPPTAQLPKRYVENIQISLSHSGNWACAIACFQRSANQKIGIDLEQLQWVDTEILPIAFSQQEQNLIHQEYWRLLQFWTAKEALLKALGLGLTVDLRDIKILPTALPNLIQACFQNSEYWIHSNHNDSYLWSWHISQ